MSTDPTAPPAPTEQEPPAQPTTATPPAEPTTAMPPARKPRLTRAGAAWVATAAALLLLTMLIVFILQNPTSVEVHYLGFTGTLPLGMALFIAAVAGGLLVGVAGVTRVTQLRMNARRVRRHEPKA
ncbi:MAG TPA: lipopolysaccharide assembly protein LapA domain-containing protein [Jiangellales bacterium]|nr:lipopolysaccharide assembly protein LapA domain-containing protein [Jiangellales bacterium]